MKLRAYKAMDERVTRELKAVTGRVHRLAERPGDEAWRVEALRITAELDQIEARVDLLKYLPGY
jgi:hypothetical protein